MSDNTVEPGSLEFKMNTAVLRMNNKLKEDGFTERECAFMWGMTVSELRVFLTTVWEHLHNEKTVAHVGEELNPDPKKEGESEQSGTDDPGAKGSDLPAAERSGDSDSSARAIRTQG